MCVQNVLSIIGGKSEENSVADFYDTLNDKLKKFIAQQKIFYTATATEDSRINLSPKGANTFRIIDDTTVAFLNLTGSGNETGAHLKSDGRITIMMSSFDKAPLIFRIYGRGENIYTDDPRFERYMNHFEVIPGIRQIVVVKIESMQTSCGYAVPFYEFKGEREALNRWAEQKGPNGVKDYWVQNNQTSIDGLPTGIFDVK